MLQERALAVCAGRGDSVSRVMPAGGEQSEKKGLAGAGPVACEAGACGRRARPLERRRK